MRNDLLMSIRTMLRRRAPLPGLDPVGDDSHDGTSPEYSRTTQKSEKLDLTRGWSPGNSAGAASPRLDQIVDDWQPEELSAIRSSSHKRERFDLMRGWVPEDRAQTHRMAEMPYRTLDVRHKAGPGQFKESRRRKLK